MNIKTKFLALSMRQQIPFTIIILTIFSVIVILSIAGPLIFEALKEDYQLKKNFFYKKYKRYIEACFFYQNYCLLKYEEIIKRIQKQILVFNTASVNFGEIYRMKQEHYEVLEEKVVKYNSTKISNEINDTLYYLCYSFREMDSSILDQNILSVLEFISLDNLTYCDKIAITMVLLYEGFSSIIATHNLGDYFRMPEFNIPIISTPYFININNSMMFSFNSSKIHDNIVKVFGDENKYNPNKFYDYYDAIVYNFIDTIMKYFIRYLNKELFLFDIVFEKNVREIKESEDISILNKNDNNSIYEFVKKRCGFYSSIRYGNNKFALLSYDMNGFFYCETEIIENYLYFTHSKLSQYLNVSFIPLYAENNTILSPELCLSFLLKQLDYQVDDNKFNELLKKIIKGKSTIEQCFINKEAIIKQLEINEVFILDKTTNFLDVANVINQGLIESEKKQYYYAKYAYPNIVSLLDFSSDYILLDQINFYLFASFKEPMEWVNSIYIIYKNCFLMIIIIIVYTWIILLIVNLIIYFKIINQLTEPIKKLQEAIESSSVKDESIFRYEYDDFIQDLFFTVKELLSGQVDKNNNEKGLNQFNILSIPKDKQKNIDKNIYQKNLIINIDIMNKKIREQQNMSDYSGSIGINEELDISRKKKKRKKSMDFVQKEDNDSFTSVSKKDREISIDNGNINKIKQNKIREEIEDREPYKKLFKIAEYFSYHQNKNENNFFYLLNNEIKDESKKPSIPKINSTNTLNIDSKKKNIILKGDNSGKNEEKDFFSINMLNNKNISYLWYMLEKQKQNKSIDYHIGTNYEELFMDDDNKKN